MNIHYLSSCLGFGVYKNVLKAYIYIIQFIHGVHLNVASLEIHNNHLAFVSERRYELRIDRVFEESLNLPTNQFFIDIDAAVSLLFPSVCVCVCKRVSHCHVHKTDKLYFIFAYRNFNVQKIK